MVLESGLAQTSQFSDTLNVRPSPAVEKTNEETAQTLKGLNSGDTVSFSKEARALAAPEKSGNSDKAKSGESEDENKNNTIEMLKKQIEKLEEEIKKLEESDLPNKEKTNQIQAKQAQLMQLNDQLLKAQQEELKASGQAVGGGTRANGAGNSVGTF